jgi:hypothetical protein
MMHYHPQESLGTTGVQFFWPLNHSAVDLDFLLLMSAVKPCEGFRVWVHHEMLKQEMEERVAFMQAKSNAKSPGLHDGGGNDDSIRFPSEGLACHVDVSAMASKLPTMHASGRLRARVWT